MRERYVGKKALDRMRSRKVGPRCLEAKSVSLSAAPSPWQQLQMKMNISSRYISQNIRKNICPAPNTDIHQDDLKRGSSGSREARETHRAESREEAHRWGRIQWKREKLLHSQWSLDSRQGGTHQGRQEAILTCVTCRRESKGNMLNCRQKPEPRSHPSERSVCLVSVDCIAFELWTV